jgi:hypothetical protein
MWLVKVLIFHVSVSSMWLTFLEFFCLLNFSPCILFLFLSLSSVLSFYKDWQGFIISN